MRVVVLALVVFFAIMTGLVLAEMAGLTTQITIRAVVMWTIPALIAIVIVVLVARIVRRGR